jgi:hypothetical protein
MQHAGQMAQAYRKLMGKDAAPQQKTLDDYLQWANLVLRTAALLLPYQRPTYRSIEVHTDKGIEERQTRYIGDPAERLAQIVTGAIIAQSDMVVPEASNDTQNPSNDAPDAAGTPRSNGRMCVAEGMGRPRCVGICENPRDCACAPAPAPVDNGDGVLS